MYLRPLLLGAMLSCLAGSVSASPIAYGVTINTSPISGTVGSLDFNFNPGPFVTQSASLQILSFGSNGILAGSPSFMGDVSGTLPSTLTFDNGSGFNDYFEGFTFGTALAFSVSLYGPALSSPDGVSTSGSAFVFSMFSDPAGTTPVLTTDTTDGFAFKVDVNLDGTATLSNFSSESSINTVSAVPEPNSFALVALAVAIFRLSARVRSGPHFRPRFLKTTDSVLVPPFR